MMGIEANGLLTQSGMPVELAKKPTRRFKSSRNKTAANVMSPRLVARTPCGQTSQTARLAGLLRPTKDVPMLDNKLMTPSTRVLA